MTCASKTLHSRGIWLLVVTTLIWGTSFPLSKHVLGSLSPAVILAVRFAIAAIAFVPLLRKLNIGLIRDGALLGCIYFAECAVALVGLETISASRSAFIVGLNVILVPLFSVVFGQRLKSRLLFAAALAIAGIGVMSWEGGGLTVGDLLTFGCAVGIAVYILALEVITPRHPTLPLVAVQLVVMTILSMIWAVPQLVGQIGAVANNLGVLAYLGVMVTATPIWTQAIAQRWVSAHEAALLYTLEPVFATVFSFCLLGGKLGVRGLVGAALILTATVLSQRQSQQFGSVRE